MRSIVHCGGGLQALDGMWQLGFLFKDWTWLKDVWGFNSVLVCRRLKIGNQLYLIYFS